MEKQGKQKQSVARDLKKILYAFLSLGAKLVATINKGYYECV